MVDQSREIEAKRDKIKKKYPLRMGRYLTEEEREDIRRNWPNTRPDWSNWKKKLESGAVSAAVRKATANEGGD